MAIGNLIYFIWNKKFYTYNCRNFHFGTFDDKYFKFLLIFDPAHQQTEKALKDLKVQVRIMCEDLYCGKTEDDDTESEESEEDEENEISEEDKKQSESEDEDEMAVDEKAKQLGKSPVYEFSARSYRLHEGYADFVVRVTVSYCLLKLFLKCKILLFSLRSMPHRFKSQHHRLHQSKLNRATEEI